MDEAEVELGLGVQKIFERARWASSLRSLGPVYENTGSNT
jgi:hypothetical protein